MPKGRNKKSTRKTKANSSKKTTRNAKQTKGFRGKRIILFLTVGVVIGLVAYAWYLDDLIQQRFDGEAWARPSRVYARPLELYSGLQISGEQIVSELNLAGYQSVKDITQPGQYSLQSGVLKAYCREFHFSDHYQPAEEIHIHLGDNEIEHVFNHSKQAGVDFFQLTPGVIGSYLPGNGEDRLVIQTDEIPQTLIDILLAVEDRRFYSHYGINPLSIGRALLANLRAGKTVQGGSTLTQQLAKNMFLTPERSLVRKINEAILALMLEARFEKDSILSAYINEVFLLQQKNTAVHGFALASRLLFKQGLNQLSSDKLALLVGMVKGPSIYNPLAHPRSAKQRRDQVLKIMLDSHLINEVEHDRLSTNPLGVVKRLPPVNPYPAYLDLVKKQLKNSYSAQDLAEKGLRIFTAFDPIKQQQLEQGLKLGLTRFDSDTMQVAVIMADYLSGDLLAMAGDRHTDFPGFNRAIHAQRPIGSLIKPLLLYGLLKNGHTLASKVEDRPIRIRQSNEMLWSPQNYDKKLHGEMTLYHAFVNSYNLPFVQLGVEGDNLKTLSQNLQKIHLLRQQVIYPSLLLGATVMTPYEVAQMYQVIASSGYFTPLTTIRQVMDKQHQVLTRIPLYSEEVFDRKTMVQVQRALIGATEDGTARYLKSRYTQKNFAGKTGTTNDLRDSWFAGFSNRYLSVVWLGDDDNQPINLSGSAGALRVWADIMQHLDDASVKLGADPQLEWHYINRLDGGKSKKNCDNSVLLPFVKGSQPRFNSECETDYLEKGIQWLQRNL